MPNIAQGGFHFTISLLVNSVIKIVHNYALHHIKFGAAKEPSEHQWCIKYQQLIANICPDKT